jgi:hypothetical protein
MAKKKSKAMPCRCAKHRFAESIAARAAISADVGKMLPLGSFATWRPKGSTRRSHDRHGEQTIDTAINMTIKTTNMTIKTTNTTIKTTNTTIKTTIVEKTSATTWPKRFGCRADESNPREGRCQAVLATSRRQGCRYRSHSSARSSVPRAWRERNQRFYRNTRKR